MLHPLALSPSFLFPLILSLFCLRDVGYGVADFQAPPVDGSRKCEQSEQDQQHPGNVDPFRGPSRFPRTNDETRSGGSEDDQQQETEQAPPPGVPPTNGRDFSAVWTSGQGSV